MNDSDIEAVKKYKSQDLQEVIEVIGAEKTLELIEALGGTDIYIPTLERVTGRMRMKRYEAMYNDYIAGLKYKEISIKYNVSVSQVQTAVKTMTELKENKES